MMVGWLAVYLPRSVISEFMRIDWETVGRCVSRVLNVIEPERTKRLDGLVHIGIDETSYRKGHKYITVIVNHDTNTVVWAAQGHGKSVLQTFYRCARRSSYRVYDLHLPCFAGRPRPGGISGSGEGDEPMKEIRNFKGENVRTERTAGGFGRRFYTKRKTATKLKTAGSKPNRSVFH